MQRPSASAALASSLLILLICGSATADTIYAWGDNGLGQLGLGDLTNPVRTPTQVRFYSDKSIASIHLAQSYHFVTTTYGDVYTSGNNYYGCLGLNLTSGLNNTYTATPVMNPSLTGKNCTIRVARRHANAVCGSTLYGWGEWAGYVLGATSGVWPKVHQSTTFKGAVSSVHTVNEGSFVVTPGSVIFAAGNGTDGQLALGSFAAQANFKRVTFFDTHPPKRVFSSQSDHACALSQSESLYCWGKNDDGQLGVGDYVSRSDPEQITAIEAGEYYVSQVQFGQSHTLILTCGGRVLSFGTRQFGVLGDGVVSNASSVTPNEIAFLSDKGIVEIIAGSNSNFARSSDGTIYSWGAGYGGILGTFSDVDVYTPVNATALSGLKINRIVMGSSSKSAFGWTSSDVFTTTQNCPALVNECLQANKCVVSLDGGVCADTDRSYRCSCQSGYSGDGTLDGSGCVDIDECAMGTSTCDARATCQNTAGSYLCVCPAGYHGNGFSTGPSAEGCIEDVNECANVTANNCSANADCLDNVWNYTCTCRPGFVGNGLLCRDVNECQINGSSPCGANATCTNNAGNFTCTCPLGFEGDAFISCTDIDECANVSTCHSNATCKNLVGSVSCTCNDGFSGDGFLCTAGPQISTTGITPNATTSASATSSTTSTSGSANATGASSTTRGSTSTSGALTSGGQSTGIYQDGNTLDVNTIAPTDTIGAATTSGGSTAAFQVSSTGATGDSQEKKILVGVFVGFIGLLIIAITITVIVVIKRRRSNTIWA